MRQCALAGFELSDLVRESIHFMREHEPAGGYFLGFSGGKDSIVTLELAKMAGVQFIAGYNSTGIDHPEVVRMIRREYPEVRIIHPKRSFWSVLKTKTPPRRNIRWCCHLLKETSEDMGLNIRIMGIRAEESAARAKLGAISKHKGKITVKPIFHWPEWAVWEFIHQHRLPYPSLYDEGFSRVGCVVCPYISGTTKGARKAREMSRERYPLLWRIHEKCVRYWWEHRVPKVSDHPTFEAFYKDLWEL